VSKSRFLCAAGLVGLLAALGAAPSPSAPRSKDDILKLFHDEFVTLTPGAGKFPAKFTMGSGGDAPKEEQPAHEVTFTHSFALAKYEVTQELYEAVMGKNPSKWKGPRNSVEMVNWEEANEFCRKATDELRTRKLLGADEIIRLPSEAEWEYACRAGTKTAYSFGDGEADLKEYAWFKGNSKGEDPPVGKKKPNAWDLYDLHGYIWEWTLDAWHADYKGAPADGSAWNEKEATDRVARGGSWNDGAERCRSAARGRFPAATRSDTIGFRCVKAKAEKK
jgi:formylglycine-generating enzyme required for sulfatase activity